MKDVVKTDINRVSNSKRNRRRQRNNSIYYIIVILLVFGVGITLSTTLLFNISDIKVVGLSQYEEDDIKSASKVKIGDNLIKTDVDTIKKNVLNTLMYVDDVRVKKQFPSNIIIEVKPSIPTAMVLYGDTYLLISENGKILEKLEEPSRNVPVIKGFVPASDIITKNVYWEYSDTNNNDETTGEDFKDDKERNKALKLICQQIKNQNLYSIKEFDISDAYSISANYQNRISIRLGNSSELEYKLKYAMQILTEQLPADKEGYLIFRSNNQYQYVSKEDMEKHIEEIAESAGIELQDSQTDEYIQTSENAEVTG